MTIQINNSDLQLFQHWQQNSNMEQQVIEQDNIVVFNREQLIAMIRSCFSASSQQEQKQAQVKVVSLLKSSAFLEKLLMLLTQSKEAYLKNDLQKAVATLIKKYSYDYAKTSEDKTSFIQTIFKIILSQNISLASKQLLGTALEHQFNEDQENRYRPTVMIKVINLLSIRESVVNLDGLVIICIAYINSLIQVEQQVEFFLNSSEALNIASINLLRQMDKLSIQDAVSKSNVLIPKIAKIFEYFELSIERIFDEEIYMTQELKKVRENKFLISILQNYLPIFSNNGSLISLKFPEINQAKRMMTNIVSMLYTNFLCPSNIFNTIYISFLVQSQHLNRDCIAQSITIDCIKLLTFHLQKKYYYKLYADNIQQTILALYMYSITSKQEYEALDNNPEQFSDIAEYYVNGQEKYHNLKVKASLFIQMVAQKIDGALKKMLQILIVIIASSLEPSSNDSQIMSQIKEQTSKFDFYGLSRQKKLETSLMMLCSISYYINRRKDVGQIIYSLFVTQFQSFSKITSSIVVLRLLRCVSCFPSALYYGWIEQQIKKGKVFAIQGIRCFQKIVRTNRYDELFNSLALIISNIIDYIAVTDPIMELMVTKQFQQMLKVSPNLLSGILRKIRSEFYKNAQTHDHQTLICFNLIYCILKKEGLSIQTSNQALAIFYEWTKFLQLSQNESLYFKYDQKIVEMFEFITTRYNKVFQQTDFFVKNSLNNLSKIDKGSQFFRLYSIYIFHSTGVQNKLETLFYAFLNEIKIRFKKFSNRQAYSEGINYFCFLLSAIISNYCKIDITQNDLSFLLEIAAKIPIQYKQYPLIVFLTHLYQFPYAARAYLHQKAIYNNFLNEVVRINFEKGIIKKIFILSLIKLLQVEDNIDNFRLILVYCINHLKKQVEQSRKSPSIHESSLPRLRPSPFEKGLQKSNKEEQQHIDNQFDNQLINLFVKFKHPFNSLSDFDQFKVLIWQNDKQANLLSQEMKADLKLILEMEWVENKTRRIVRVKK